MNGRGGSSNRRLWQRVQIVSSATDEANGPARDTNQSNSHVNGFNDPNQFAEPVGPHLDKPRIGIGNTNVPFRQVPRREQNYYGSAGPSKRFNQKNLSRYGNQSGKRFQSTFQKNKWQPSDKNQKKKKKDKNQGGFPRGKASKTSKSKSFNGPKQMKKKFATPRTAFSTLKAVIINESKFAGKSIQDCYKLIVSGVRPSSRQNVKTVEVPADTTFQNLYDALKKEVEDEFNKRILYSCKKTSRANIDSSLGQVLAGVVKFEDEKKLPRGGWRKVLRNAILHFTKAICKLENSTDARNITTAKKALNEKAICDLYYSRAQVYCMLQRYGDFWSDALVALSLSPQVKQMELVSKLVEKRIEQVRRNADPRKKNRRISDAALKKWREETRATLKRAEDFLLLQAIIDQQNDNKINRLMAYYMQINQLRKERLVEGDKQKPAKANAAPQKKKPRAPATNIFDKVDVLEDNRLRVNVNIAKNRIVFYEQVIAFEAGSGKGSVNQNCANCFRRLNLCKAVPCSVCSDALFCNAVCREVAQGHTFSCQFTAQVRSKLSKNSYLAYQVICYANFFILFTAEKTNGYINTFKNPTSTEQIDYWPRYAGIVSVQKRIGCQEIVTVTQNDQHLLADAIYLTTVLMQLQAAKLHESQKVSAADTIYVFSMTYKLLWIMHHDPLATSRLGKKKDFAICPFGNLLNFSCKPNIKRKFNQKKGRIEYQALVDLKPNDILSVGWGTYLYAKEKANQEKLKRAQAPGKGNSAAPRTAVPKTRSEIISKLFAWDHPPCFYCPNSTG